MRKEKTEQTYRSSEETKQGAPDKEVQAPSMSRGDRSSASHPSTISSNTKSSSSRTLVSSSQAISGRDTDTGSSNSQSSSYGTQRWLDQTPRRSRGTLLAVPETFIAWKTPMTIPIQRRAMARGTRIAMAASKWFSWRRTVRLDNTPVRTSTASERKG